MGNNKFKDALKVYNRMNSRGKKAVGLAGITLAAAIGTGTYIAINSNDGDEQRSPSIQEVLEKGTTRGELGISQERKNEIEKFEKFINNIDENTPNSEIYRQISVGRQNYGDVLKEKIAEKMDTTAEDVTFNINESQGNNICQAIVDGTVYEEKDSISQIFGDKNEISEDLADAITYMGDINTLEKKMQFGDAKVDRIQAIEVLKELGDRVNKAATSELKYSDGKISMEYAELVNNKEITAQKETENAKWTVTTVKNDKAKTAENNEMEL